MFDLIENQSVMLKDGYWGPAEILELDQSDGLVRIRLPGREDEDEAWARLAVPYEHEPGRGQMALVAGPSNNHLYVIGLLNAPRSTIREARQVVLRNGASAAVVGSPGTEKLEVRSKAGDLVIEYDSETGKTLVNATAGDLEFVTRNGNIDFSSGQNIRFSSKQRIEMRSVFGIRLATTNAIGKLLSNLTLHPGKLRMTSSEMVIEAQKSELRIVETKYVGTRFSSTIAHARLVTGKLETLTNDVVQKAKNIYTRVEELTQLTTKRMRTLVDSTYHLKSQKAFFKAEEDFKVNAERIHLG